MAKKTKKRDRPNIIITGTPGVGKTSHCELVSQQTDLRHLNINDVVKERGFMEEYDEELDTWVVDEDKLLDEIEDRVLQGGNIIDWHVCDVFPKSWIDLVVVLRADNTILFDRLKGRNYSERKLTENIDAEIMQVILEDARDAYDEEVVIELQSDDSDQMESNVERIVEWTKQWIEDNT